MLVIILSSESQETLKNNVNEELRKLTVKGMQTDVVYVSPSYNPSNNNFLFSAMIKFGTDLYRLP